jgi:hypothetical protein
MRRLLPIAVQGVASPGAALLHTGPRSRSKPRELLLTGLGLAVITLLMCAPHIRNGGFYYDDWGVVALGRFPSPGGLLHGLWLDYGQRPGQVLYYAALDEAFGTHAPLRLALAASAVLLQATCLYALLRALGLAARHAACVAALSLSFPFSDSLWLWGILSLTSLAITASLLGLILALRAFQSSGGRALALHAASLALFVVSILSYEVFAVAGSLAGLLYVHAVGLRRARVRWASDVAAIGLTLLVSRTALPIDVATPSQMQSLGGMTAHLGLIARAGVQLAGVAALPVAGISPWVGAGLLATVLAAAAVLRRRLPDEDAARAELGRWLAIAGVGVLVAAAAWMVYVPAPDHYSPIASGTVNRVNAAAAIGIAVLVYSSLVLLAGLLTRLLRLPSASAALLAAAATIVLGTGYLKQTAADARAWDAAAADQRRLLADLHAILPRPGRAATLYVFDAPQKVGPGIPVLNTTLDLTSALRISYASSALTGVPLETASGVICGARGPSANGVTGAYRAAYSVDIGARRAIRLIGPRQCAAQDLRPPATPRAASEPAAGPRARRAAEPFR